MALTIGDRFALGGIAVLFLLYWIADDRSRRTVGMVAVFCTFTWTLRKVSDWYQNRASRTGE